VRPVPEQLQIYGHISYWDTSRVINFSRLFSHAAGIRKLYETTDLEIPDISLWDTSNVTRMDEMFMGFRKFDHPIGKWNVSKVINMRCIFRGCEAFNQPLNDWDVSEVTSMSYMFAKTSFNQPLDKWNVGKVSSMSGMFQETPFNQMIEKWDISQVTDMTHMFYYASAFNQPLERWFARRDSNCNTERWLTFTTPIIATSIQPPLVSYSKSKEPNKIKYIEHMFCEATSFNQPLNN
jgi:surface protein